MTHEQLILRALEVRGAQGATIRELEGLTGVPYAARRIHDMRRKGMDIRTERVHVGKYAVIARYVLPQPTGLRFGVRS